MTGGSGLSRKLLTVVILSLPMFAQAQSVNNTATGPNNVYIEQIGNSNTITIQQVGGTNNVGGISGTTISTDSNGVTTWNATAPSGSNYGTINGSSNTVGITQTGNANSSQYNIRGNNNSYSSTVTGDSNTNFLQIGNANSTTNLRNSVTDTITGNSNQTLRKVVGNDITSVLNATGSYNQVTENLLSTKGYSNIAITGGNNIFYSEQTDVAGANGHSLTAVVAGDYNSIVTQQQGNNDTTVNIKNTGDHNTITVRTSSSTIINPLTSAVR
jgi:hypothetical protein